MGGDNGGGLPRFSYDPRSGKYTFIDNTADTEYSIRGLDNGTEYHFAVSAFVDGDMSSLGADCTVSAVPQESIGKPVFTAAKAEEGAVVFWNDAENAVSYKVYAFRPDGSYKASPSVRAHGYAVELDSTEGYRFLTEATDGTDWTGYTEDDLLTAEPYDADIVFVGDSLTAHNDFAAAFPDKKTVNLANPASTLAEMRGRAWAVKALSPEKIFVMGGLYDMRGMSTSLDDLCAAYGELLDVLQGYAPEAEIYIQGLLPISEERESTVGSNGKIRSFNGMLKEMAEQRGMTYIELYPLYELDGHLDPSKTYDGIHPVDEAYSYWEEAISGYIYS